MSWFREVEDLSAYFRFARGLRPFLRSPRPVQEVLSEIRRRQDNRPEAFLEMVRNCIYSRPESPYLKLLESAGCAFGDLEESVGSRGVETTLQDLAREDVYITVEEFKGNSPVERKGVAFKTREEDFRNPAAKGDLVSSSGGSRSRGLRTVYEFRNLTENWTAHLVLRLASYELLDAPIAVWYPVMPGAGPVVVLSLIKAGLFPAWFTPLEVGDASRKMRSRMGNRFIVRMGKSTDSRFPAPVFAPFQEPGRVVDWLSEQLARRRRCTLMTYVSGAVRVAQAARTRGLDLSGACFSVSSEPLTSAKKTEIERSGARAIPNFSTMESGILAAGCLEATRPDDMHLLDDSIALIQRDRVLQEHRVSVKALMITGLLNSFPKVLFNTETGDYADLMDISCGCPFEELGFSRHLVGVYGFDKLTGAGMTFVGSDLIRIIETVLPERFGGTSLDFQMMEEEDETGQTRMSLLISPRLGELDVTEVRRTVLDELGGDSESTRFMARVWSESDTLRVRRQEPVPTGRGKLLPLHLKTGPLNNP